MFNSLLNSISNLFVRKSTSVIGIDVGSSSIKIVQLARKGGKAILETYGELSLGPYAGVEVGHATSLPPEKIAEALNDVMREAKATAKSVALAIPFGASLITAIEMPVVPQKQLSQMIPLEARKYIPVPITEVSLDWWIIPKSTDKSADLTGEIDQKADQSDKVDVMLVAIHNETISHYQSIVNSAALQASFFEIEIFSTIRSVADPDLPIQMIIDLGAASTKMYIVEKGIIRSSHIVNSGGQDATIAISKALSVSMQNAEIMKRDTTQIPKDRTNDVRDVLSVTLDFVFSEAHQVILSYQRKYGKDIPKVILVGGGSMLLGIRELAEKKLETTVELGNPFSKVDAPAVLAEVLKTSYPEFAVSVGIALRKLSETK